MCYHIKKSIITVTTEFSYPCLTPEQLSIRKHNRSTSQVHVTFVLWSYCSDSYLTCSTS